MEVTQKFLHPDEPIPLSDVTAVATRAYSGDMKISCRIKYINAAASGGALAVEVTKISAAISTAVDHLRTFHISPDKFAISLHTPMPASS